ncbi:MAG: hypothetical protein IAE86_19760 [Burkholderiaceae bacterium]|nr:hypothetical protein [Burkholderiaceae bacterium]
MSVALSRRTLCSGLAAAAAAACAPRAALAAALAAPLERPALRLRDPRRAAMLGLAQAGPRIVAVGERGTVLLSDDAGSSWRQAASVPISATLTAVQFASERVGWAVGHYGVVLRSDDGGEHWTRQLEGSAAAQLMLADAKATGNARAVAEAERAVQEGTDKPLLALQFANDSDGIVAGAFNLLLQTKDGGKTWVSIASRLDNPKSAHLYALYRSGVELLVAGEQGLLAYSGDGGGSFERVETPYKGSYFCVAREAGGSWLVAGLRGTALRSRDGGRNWTTLAVPAPVSLTALAPAAGGETWLANQAGQVLAATPSADKLELVVQTSAQQPSDLLRLGPDALLVAGWNGITRAVDLPHAR